MLLREAMGANLVDLLDRIVDKGIVVDAWVTLSPAGGARGFNVARIVVASVETHLPSAEPIVQAVRPLRFKPAVS
jgi:gas vesicle structural protein